ncbi:hypothetical protein P7K49_038171, partial [Saguinus oedipus]
KVAICSGDQGNWALGGAFLQRLPPPRAASSSWPAPIQPQSQHCPPDRPHPPPRAPGWWKLRLAAKQSAAAGRTWSLAVTQTEAYANEIMRPGCLCARTWKRGAQIKCGDLDDLEGGGEGGGRKPRENKAPGRRPPK